MCPWTLLQVKAHTKLGIYFQLGAYTRVHMAFLALEAGAVAARDTHVAVKPGVCDYERQSPHEVQPCFCVYLWACVNLSHSTHAFIA